MTSTLNPTNASVPPEARGVARDGVRLLVAGTTISETLFHELPQFLEPGDLLVVNTSATLPAAVDARRRGEPVVVHLASPNDDGTWIVEVRPPAPAFGPVADIEAGEQLDLPVGSLTVLGTLPGQRRLHRAALDVDAEQLMREHGRAIAYGYVPKTWPLEAYQTVFARVPGSAEMPSAGRPFTPAVVTDLVSRGVTIAPLVLHTGVSSPELGEPPRPERFDVPAATARLVNATRAAGGRVVAVGTTVTRALESVAEPDGTVRTGRGWTDLVLSSERPARAVSGLVTGWHEPGASHVHLLEAVAGEDLVSRAYDEALARGFLWHEFGDSCLLLPER